jgi:predicted extracellular nuclease
MKRVFTILGIITLFATTAHAQMRITEWMYNGKLDANGLGEFIEFTNVGYSAIDMTGWSFDDSSRTPGSGSLSAFLTVSAGESVILTDATAAAFRTAWGLSEAVKVIGGNSNNLSRNSDEINLYDSSSALVDQLTYDDQNGVDPHKGPRTQYKSGNIPLAFLGQNNASAAVLSVAADSYLSHVATDGDIGNPGVYTPYVPAPEPGTFALLAVGLVALVGLRRRWL